jgi:histidine ammonia-lyase
MTAARHAFAILDNAMRVLAIELYTASRAMDLRLRQMPQAIMGAGTGLVYSRIRKEVPYKAGDTWWGPEIDRVYAMIRQDELLVDIPE